MKKDKLLLISIILNVLCIILFTIMIVSKPKPKEIFIIDESSKQHIDFLENLVDDLSDQNYKLNLSLDSLKKQKTNIRKKHDKENNIVDTIHANKLDSIIRSNW